MFNLFSLNINYFSLKNGLKFLISFLLFYVLQYYIRYFIRRRNSLPGPIPLPIIGNCHQIGIKFNKFANEQTKKYGNFWEFYIGNQRNIVISQPRLIQELYIENNNSINYFTKYKNIKLDLDNIIINYGAIFNNDHEKWKIYRRIFEKSICSINFLKGLTKSIQNIFNDVELNWNNQLQEMKNNDIISLDLSVWSRYFLTDIILTTSTKKSSYCFMKTNNNNKDNDENISKTQEKINNSLILFNSIETYFHSLIYSNSIPQLIRSYLPGFRGLSEKFRRNNKWLFYNLLEMIKQRRKEIDLMKENEPINSTDLLDILLTINTPRDSNGFGFGFDEFDNEKPMTDHEILATILDIDIGGRDPTASTFCFAVYNICKNPGVLQRLREEIIEVLGNDFLRPITFEDLNKFQYLEAIIKETQRIIPLNPLMTRQTHVKTTLNGHIIEKGTPIWLHQEKLHKDKISWYEPEKFIPDRFFNNYNNKEVDKEKNSFIPWCDGIIRNCPGKKLAIVMLKCLLILLFRKYNVELVDKISPAKVVYFGTNRSFDLKVNLKKIESFY